MMACRGSCCCLGLGSASEDTARFAMLALLILVYLVCGAAVFSALERPEEEQARGRWARSFDLFSRKHNVSRRELEGFLKAYEEATGAGIRVDRPRARWDFQGAFYFVGTVVSTIGKRHHPIQVQNDQNYPSAQKGTCRTMHTLCLLRLCSFYLEISLYYSDL